MSWIPHLLRTGPSQGTVVREVTTASLTLLSVRSLGLALGLVANILLARLLGVEEYGVWAVIMATIALLVIPASVGLPTLLVREVAMARARDDWSTLLGVYKWSLRVALATSLAIGLVWGGIALLLPIRQVLSPLLIAAVALMIPLRSLAVVQSGYLRGLNHVSLSALPEFTGDRLVLVGFLTFVYLYLPDRFSLSTAIWIQVGAAALTLSLLIGLGYRLVPALSRIAKSASQRSSWRKSALTLAATQGLFELQAQIDKLMIGGLSSPGQVGLYSSAQRWASLLGFLMVTVNLVLGPVFADLLAREDRKGAEQLARKAVLIVFALGFVGAIFFWLWGENLLGLFGADFIVGDSALRLLLVGQLVNLGAGAVGTILVMAKRETIVTAAVGISTIVNMLLNLALVRRFGANGAAMATSISTISWNLILLWAVRRFLGINPSIFGGALCRA